jgi:hypothetical protein
LELKEIRGSGRGSSLTEMEIRKDVRTSITNKRKIVMTSEVAYAFHVKGHLKKGG